MLSVGITLAVLPADKVPVITPVAKILNKLFLLILAELRVPVAV